MKTKLYYLIFLCTLITSTSCKKDWLGKKRDISVIVPTTLQDLRLLLSVDLPLNYDTRCLTEISSDDFYLPKSVIDGLDYKYEANAYLWKKEIFEGATNILDWNDAYKQVLFANVALDALAKIARTESNKTEYDDIKGSALFFRSRAFLNLVMTFSKYYDASTANADLGIPLKMTSNINESITRATVQQVYDQITTDLITATNLLAISVPTIRTMDATKVSALGLLARCYLFMDNYPLALQAANSCYALKNSLIDFNTLNPSTRRPITSSNIENHIYSNLWGGYTSDGPDSRVDQVLYNSYDNNDLRKTIFFAAVTDGFQFRGSYLGSATNFAATATDEIILIRAECKARLNDATGAIADLNTLLEKRFKTGTFIKLSAANADEALEIILRERRKELIRRGLRWQDLKRLNRDPRFIKTLTREFNGTTYTLPPNDARYILPIPDDIIQFSGITQNLR